MFIGFSTVLGCAIQTVPTRTGKMKRKFSIQVIRKKYIKKFGKFSVSQGKLDQKIITFFT